MKILPDEFLERLLHNKPRAVFWVMAIILVIVSMSVFKGMPGSGAMDNARTGNAARSAGQDNKIGPESIDNLLQPELARFNRYFDDNPRDFFKEVVSSIPEIEIETHTEGEKKEDVFPLEFTGVIKINEEYVAILKESATGRVYFKKEDEDILDMCLKSIFSDRVILIKGNDSESIELYRAGENTKEAGE